MKKMKLPETVNKEFRAKHKMGDWILDPQRKQGKMKQLSGSISIPCENCNDVLTFVLPRAAIFEKADLVTYNTCYICKTKMVITIKILDYKVVDESIKNKTPDKGSASFIKKLGGKL